MEGDCDTYDIDLLQTVSVCLSTRLACIQVEIHDFNYCQQQCISKQVQSQVHVYTICKASQKQDRNNKKSLPMFWGIATCVAMHNRDGVHYRQDCNMTAAYTSQCQFSSLQQPQDVLM